MCYKTEVSSLEEKAGVDRRTIQRFYSILHGKISEHLLNLNDYKNGGNFHVVKIDETHWGRRFCVIGIVDNNTRKLLFGLFKINISKQLIILLNIF